MNAVALSFLIFAQPAAASSALQVQTVTQAASGPRLRYEGRFPRVDGIRDEENEQKINIILRERAEASQKLAELAARRLEGTGTAVQGSYGFTVARNGDGVLSLVMRDRLSVGGARGMEQQTALTVGTVGGQIYRLKDFFLPNADYRAVLSDAIRNQIASRGLAEKQTRSFNKIQPDEDFYLTKDSLVIFFQQYEYFPYECGITEFPIPLKSLEGIWKPGVTLH